MLSEMREIVARELSFIPPITTRCPVQCKQLRPSYYYHMFGELDVDVWCRIEWTPLWRLLSHSLLCGELVTDRMAPHEFSVHLRTRCLVQLDAKMLWYSCYYTHQRVLSWCLVLHMHQHILGLGFLVRGGHFSTGSTIRIPFRVSCVSVCVSVIIRATNDTNLLAGGWKSKILSDFPWKCFVAKLKRFPLVRHMATW